MRVQPQQLPRPQQQQQPDVAWVIQQQMQLQHTHPHGPTSLSSSAAAAAAAGGLGAAAAAAAAGAAGGGGGGGGGAAAADQGVSAYDPAQQLLQQQLNQQQASQQQVVGITPMQVPTRLLRIIGPTADTPLMALGPLLALHTSQRDAAAAVAADEPWGVVGSSSQGVAPLPIYPASTTADAVTLMSTGGQGNMAAAAAAGKAPDAATATAGRGLVGVRWLPSGPHMPATAGSRVLTPSPAAAAAARDFRGAGQVSY
jgi:hypothetical protein